MSKNRDAISRGINHQLFLYIFFFITLPYSPIVLLFGWFFRYLLRKTTENRRLRKNAFFAFHFGLYALLYFGPSFIGASRPFEFISLTTIFTLLGCVGWYLVVLDMIQGSDEERDPEVKPVLGGRFATMFDDLDAYGEWKRKKEIRKFKRLIVSVGVLVFFVTVSDLVQRFF